MVRLNDPSFQRVDSQQLTDEEFKLGNDSLVSARELFAFIANLLGFSELGKKLVAGTDAATIRALIEALSIADLEGYVKKVNGFIPTSDLPNEYLVNTKTVSSEAEMIALPFGRGDYCWRTDVLGEDASTGGSYFDLTGDDPRVATNWVRRLQSGLRSVNRQAGPDVLLGAADVGAEPIGAVANLRDRLLALIEQRQPLDPDLSAIAALTTTEFGRSLLTQESLSALRSLIGAGAPTRATETLTTPSLAAGATGNYAIALAKSFRLIRVEANTSCRLRMYGSIAYRTSDAARAVGTELGLNKGLISEVIFGGQSFFDLDNTQGSSVENPPSSTIPIAITNSGGASAAIALTFTYLKMED